MGDLPPPPATREVTKEEVWCRTPARIEPTTHRDLLVLVVGPSGQGDSDAAAHHLPVDDGHDDLVRRRAGLLQRLVRLVNQLLQLLWQSGA